MGSTLKCSLCGSAERLVKVGRFHLCPMCLSDIVEDLLIDGWEALERALTTEIVDRISDMIEANL